VCRDHPRSGDDLAAALGFHRRQLEVDQVVAFEYGQCKASRRILDRHVHVVAIREVGELYRENGGVVRVGQVVQHGIDHRVRAAAGTGNHGGAVVPVLAVGGEAETNAQVTAQVVIHDDDARFDEYLANRNVERADEPANVLQLLGRILHEQGVGAIVDRHRTTFR